MSDEQRTTHHLHVEERRDNVSHGAVVLPDTDGELLAFLTTLEDVLSSLERVADDDELLLPAALVDGRASDAVGRLARSVASGEKTALQPVASPVGVVIWTPRAQLDASCSAWA